VEREGTGTRAIGEGKGKITGKGRKTEKERVAVETLNLNFR
jgi:hypothetical protein